VPYLAGVNEDGSDGDVVAEVRPDRALTLGRGSQCPVRLRDPMVSRMHCQVFLAGDGVTLTDLESANGTSVNEQQVTSVALRDGDVVRVGDTRLRYRSGTPPAPEEARLGPETPSVLPEAPTIEHRAVGGPRVAPETPSGRSPADRAARLDIARRTPERPPKKSEALCGSCGRVVSARELKSGAATDFHGQVCCPDCAEEDPLIGKTIAGYRVDAKLGEGAWASTYRAEQLSMARSVVLRVVKPEITSAPDVVDAFLASVKRGGQISHPNLVRVYDIGRAEQQCYVSVEYVDGESAARVAPRRPGLSIDAAVHLVADVAGAVDVAHRRDVFHRDIRPANILLNQDRVPKLCGLGFAVSIEGAAAAETVRIPHPAEVVAYWAPECLADPGRASRQADVYALGAVAYTLLAGGAPFAAENPAELLRMILQVRPRPLDALRSDIPHRLSAVVSKAMAKDPADRYAECRQLASDLRQSIR